MGQYVYTYIHLGDEMYIHIDFVNVYTFERQYVYTDIHLRVKRGLICIYVYTFEG